MSESHRRREMVDPRCKKVMEKRTSGSSVLESHGRRGLGDLLRRGVMEEED